MKTTHKIAVWFGGAGLLITLMVMLSLYLVRQSEDAAAWQKHTSLVLDTAEKLLSGLKDAEIAQRGYLLTGVEAYLEPYLAVRDSIALRLAELRRLTQDNPAQQHRLDVLAPLIDTKLAKVEQLIALRRDQDVEGTLGKMRSGRGKQLMDAIRAEMRDFIKLEDSSLAQHEDHFKVGLSRLLTFITALSMFVALLASVSAYLVYRETRRRMSIQEQANKELELAFSSLQVSEERLAVTLNSIGDAVIATDAEACVTLLNPLAEQLTGWTQAEAAGRPVDDVFHIINQETRQPATIPVKETLARGTIQGLANHTALIARDGSECAIADSCAPIRDRDGQVVGAVLVFRDTNKEYAAQQALRDSAARTHAILNSVGEGLQGIDLEGNVIFANPAAVTMLGWSVQEMVGHHAHSMMHHTRADGSPYPSSECHIYATLQHGAICHIEDEVFWRKDGTSISVAYTSTPMKNEAGEIEGAIVSFLDNTARKQAEAALLKAGALQKAIFDSANFSSIATDAKGVIQIFNVGAERMLGYAAADVMNKITPADISDPEEVIARAEALSAELNTKITPGFEALVFKASRGIEDIYELTYIRKDGSRFPAVVSVTALRDEQKAIIGYLLIGTDNTARKQAEAALLKAGALQKAIFDSANFSSIATDAKGVIQIFNVGAERMLGYAAADVMNKITPADISDPEEVIARAEALSAELNTKITPGFEALVFKASRGIEDIYELTYIRKDGSRFPAVVSVTALRDAQNSIIGYLLIGTDNTARKQVETERAQLYQVLQDKNTELERATSVAEKANLAKDSFLATMSHEIRTPLTGMLGMLEVLSLTSLDHDQDETLKAVWDSSRSLLRIVNDILDWSKIEEGKLALAPRATSIPQLLQEVIITYSRVASSKSLTLWQHADARLSVAHIVDPLRLSQVLNNFVSNALKFTQRGEIELRAELLEQLDSGERIRFSVKDTGIGIAREAQQHLFQRYRQASADTARMYGGTGLGLSICRRLADLMDGQIELVSEPGQGATFSITLTMPVSGAPVAPITTPFPNVEQKKVKPLLDGSADAPLVLAVDDHPINRDLLMRQIKLLGLRGETAENGKVALPLWREGRFALVITDCHMPEMDGYALTRAIRQIEAEERLPHTPVIAWTANALAEEEVLCYTAGMDELLVKPTDLTQLKKMLAKWLHIAETDSSQPASSLHDAESGQIAGPINFADLSNVVPDSKEQIQVLHNFQAHIRADRARLLEMLEQGDQANVERTAHRMKGSSRMVGAKDMANACAAIEQAARSVDMGGARAAMTGLDEAIQRLETYLIGLNDPKGESR